MESKDVDRMIELYKKGMSARAAGEIYGVTSSTVYDYMKKRGISRRLRRDATRLANGSSLNDSAFDTITPSSAYWLGFFAADACIAKTGYELIVGLQRNDAPHLEKLRYFLKSSAKVTYYEGLRRGTITKGAKLRVYSKHLVTKLAAYNLVPNKTYTISPTPELQDSRDYWRGVCDGDGSLCIGNNYPTLYMVGSIDMVSGFRQHIADAIREPKGRVLTKGNIFCFTMRGTLAQAAMEYLYQPSDEYYLDRKMRRALEYTGRATPD
jgi:hypothetical protein